MKQEKNYRQTTREVGLRLRLMRDYLELSGVEACEKFGCSQGMVTLYEAGKENPNLLYLHKITRACGLTIDDLLLDKKEFMQKLYFS